VSDYDGEVTGYNKYDKNLKVHLRAIRAFIGLLRNACSLGVMSEVDWLLPSFQTKMKILGQYHRIVNISNNLVNLQWCHSQLIFDVWLYTHVLLV
jgi:hypothetical protein